MKRLGRQAARGLWLTLGVTTLALGAIGVFVPLLPTTPFVLVSAFAFARSSRRLHDWLLAHRVFGKLIEDWRRYGAIDRQAKLLSVLSMIAVLVISVVLGVPTHAILIQAIVLSASAYFVLSRPSPPDQS